tara:strand:+ start:4350 stop:5063 length:714 start_codon:yes stop_codon:yes gene_type:complete
MALAGSKEQPVDAFVFSWAKDRLTWLYVTAFLIFSVTIHGAGFYLFQVVYPAPVRLEPEQESLTVMDVSDPEVRSLFQRLQDRTVYLVSPSGQSDVRIRLEDHQVRFTPSFQRADVEPIPPLYPWSLSPHVVDDTLRPDPSYLNQKTKSAMTFDAALSAREVAPWSILNDYLGRAEEVPAFRAEIEVSLDGLVTVIQIDSNLEESDRNELIQVIESTLRFRPGDSKITGWLDIWARG